MEDREMTKQAGAVQQDTDGLDARKDCPDKEESRMEDMLAQVEYCIEQLENPQISLEDSFRYYEEGVKKLKECSGKVEQIEQKMMVINKQGELEEF